METAVSAANINSKTLRRLRKAYCRLIREVGADKITVSSLTEEADIARATFYLYYPNIEEFKDDTMKYIISLFIKQIRMFLEAGRANAKEVSKRKNLIFTDDDFDLFNCLFSKTKGFGFDQKVFEYVFNYFSENITVYFDKKFVKKNKERFDLFYIGYAGAMRDNFIDYHPDKVYRDILRTVEIWEFFFPERKYKD